MTSVPLTVTNMATIPRESLLFIVNHVIFPPKLPQGAESPAISRQAEQDLLRLVLRQVKAYRAKCSPDFSELWPIIDKMLAHWITLNSAEMLSSKALAKIFAEMQVRGEF